MHSINLDELTPLGGGWAMRSLFDALTENQLNGVKIELLPMLFKASKTASGHSAVRHYEKILQVGKLNPLDAPPAPDNHLKNVCKKLPVLKKLPSEQSELSPFFWVSYISNFLNAAPGKDLTDSIKKVLIEDDFSELPTKELLLTWSFPYIRKMLSVEKGDSQSVEVVVNDSAHLRWRRWYQHKTGHPLLLISGNRCGFSNHRWLTCCVLHDGAHLFHIINHPGACNTYSIPHLALMESFAMYTERSLLHSIENGYRIEEDLPSFNTKAVKTFLLLGLFERAARAYYDIVVHGDGVEVSKWLNEYVPQFGIDLPIYDFSYEFHGLPGLSTIYMLGMKTFHSIDVGRFIQGGHEEEFLSIAKKVAANDN